MSPEPGADRLAAADKVARRTHEHSGAGTAAPTVSNRNAYRAPMGRTWFMASHEYRSYALREFSAFVVGLFVFDLMVGMVAIAMGPEQWDWWVRMQRNPLNLLLTVLALIAAGIHTVSWFQLTPAIIKVQRGTKYLADKWVILQHVVLLAIFAAIMVAWLGGAW